MQLKWLFVVYVLGVVVNCDKIPKVIKITQGTLKGTKEHSHYARKMYYSFKGIPYAEPCVGRRKFDISRPAQPWQGEYDASAYKPQCPQMHIYTMQPHGSEDCLYLNVFTPNATDDAKLPVMVYFYAGLFQLGSADDEYYDPEFLLEKNVVVVTFNYRLGPIGFLSTMDGHCPGNVGMKDQVLALKWVQQNILAFGGDPEKVTLFGQSSGATSVHLHMLSPMSKGLFRACIMQSGVGVQWWAISRDPRPDAFALGRALNIHTNDTKELMDRLKDTSADDLIMAVAKLYEEVSFPEFNREDIFPFAPSVEPSAGQEVFLPEEPWKIMRSGKIAEVPIIIGVTANESTVLGRDIVEKDSIIFIIQYMCHVLKIREQYQINEIIKYTEPFYLGNKTLDESDAREDVYFQWLSDMAMNVEVIITAKIFSYRIAHPVYLYKFSYLASFGMFKDLFMPTELNGVAHGDDLTYLFHSHLNQHKQIINPENQKMVDIMTKLWTNFARDLNPTSVRDADINFDWDRLDNYNKYLDIDLEPMMGKNLFSENVKLWVKVLENDLQEYAGIFN